MRLHDIDDECLELHHTASGRLVAPIHPERRRPLREKVFAEFKKAYEKGIDFEKGFVLENLFFGMVKAIMRRHLVWNLIKIRRASRNQDRKYKIDFWLDIKSDLGVEYSIPVQIKSSWIGADDFIRKYGDKVAHIHVIVMNQHMNNRVLIHRLRRIVNMELERLHAQSQPTSP